MKTDAEWRNILTPEQYLVLRRKGTERPGTGKFYHHDQEGTYTCAGCGLPLFDSRDKYDSGSGWPSFKKPENRSAVKEQSDTDYEMVRTELLCSRCGGHLGHVFPDGPQPTGMRYCVNSAALGFVPGDKNAKEAARRAAGGGEATGTTEIMTVGGGCFWCVEAVFERLPGVINVQSGYMGGTKADPTYREVCNGDTGHAEVVQITFDPGVISYETLLAHFWEMHDPTTPDRQGADVGSQYRSVIFWHSEEQRQAAEKERDALSASGKYADPVVTQIVRAQPFYMAEDYHQDYFQRNSNQPYCRAVIQPKLRKLGL